MTTPRRPPKIPRPTPVVRVRRSVRDEEVHSLPIIEATDVPGEKLVTFCWRDAEAEAVLLFANRLTDETSLSDTLLERAPGSDLWHASFRMRSDWRASYCFLVHSPGESAPWETYGQVSLRAALDRGLPDPHNPRTCRNRAGVVQSVVALPDAPAQPWLMPRAGVSHGSVERLVGPGGRDVWIYDPPGSDARTPLPLAVVLDGEVWTSSQSLPTTLDNLRADEALPPTRAVFVGSGGRDSRWSELGSEAGVDHLVEHVVPWVSTIRTIDAARVVVVGQSLGGLTALRAGLRHPDVFAGVVSSSASLWQDDLVSCVPRTSPVRIHLAHGAQEWVLAEPHERFAARLRTAAMAVQAVSHNGGHDYAWWRGDVADGLRWVLSAQ